MSIAEFVALALGAAAKQAVLATPPDISTAADVVGDAVSLGAAGALGAAAGAKTAAAVQKGNTATEKIRHQPAARPAAREFQPVVGNQVLDIIRYTPDTKRPQSSARRLVSVLAEMAFGHSPRYDRIASASPEPSIAESSKHAPASSAAPHPRPGARPNRKPKR